MVLLLGASGHELERPFFCCCRLDKLERDRWPLLSLSLHFGLDKRPERDPYPPRLEGDAARDAALFSPSFLS